MNEYEQILKDRLSKLPPPIKQLLLGGEFEKKFQELYQKWGVHADVAKQIENETILVLVGLEPPQDFARNLTKNIDLEPEKVGKIALDVNETIFQPLRKTILTLSEAGANEKQEIEPKPVVPKNVQNEAQQKKEEVPNNVPIQKNTPAPQPQTVQTSTPPTPSRTEEPMRTVRKETEKTPEEGTEQQKKSTYGVGDPYREPIDDEEK